MINYFKKSGLLFAVIIMSSQALAIDEMRITNGKLLKSSGVTVAAAAHNPVDGSVSDKSSPAITNPKININSATADQLSSLDGIGHKRAETIVEYRTQHGPFATVDDLLKIKGLGKKMLDRNRDRLSVN